MEGSNLIATVEGRECAKSVEGVMEDFNAALKSGSLSDTSDLAVALEKIKAGCESGAAFQQTAVKEGALGGVAFCTKQYVEDAAIVELALTCCAKLAGGTGVAALKKKEALPKKAVEAICECLRHHIDSEAVVASGASAVQKLCRQHEPTKAAFKEAGLNKFIQAALRKQKGSKRAIAAVCGLICVYTADDDRREGVHPGTFVRARELAEDRRKGAIVPLFEALKAHADDARFVGDACFALKHLAVNDTICKNMTRVGGLDATLDALGAHVTEATVAERACAFLKSVARNDDNKRILCLVGSSGSEPCDGVARGLGLIVHSLETHINAAAVAEQALAAMSVVSLRQPEICTRIAEAGMVGLIVASMAKYPEKPAVQRAAMITLRNMVSSWQNGDLKQTILDEGAENAIRAARAAHPECEDVAFAALRDLGCAITLNTAYKI